MHRERINAGKIIIFGVCLLYKTVAPVSPAQRGMGPARISIKSIITVPGAWSTLVLLLLWNFERKKWASNYRTISRGFC